MMPLRAIPPLPDLHSMSNGALQAVHRPLSEGYGREKSGVVSTRKIILNSSILSGVGPIAPLTDAYSHLRIVFTLRRDDQLGSALTSFYNIFKTHGSALNMESKIKCIRLLSLGIGRYNTLTHQSHQATFASWHEGLSGIFLGLKNSASQLGDVVSERVSDFIVSCSRIILGNQNI